MKAVVVGAGIAGAAAARTLLDAGYSVDVIEQQASIGGLCRDKQTPAGYLQEFGPHWFHTADPEIWAFVERFGALIESNQMAGTYIDGQIVPLPICEESERILGRRLSADDIEALVFRNYSAKQWGIPWEELPDAIAGRVPQKLEGERRSYFPPNHRQGVPRGLWSDIIAAMLDGGEVRLGEPWYRVRGDYNDMPVVYTGHLDELCHYAIGALPWRGARFSWLPGGAGICEGYHCVTWPPEWIPLLRTYALCHFSGSGDLPGLLGMQYPAQPMSSEDRLYPLPTPEGRRLWTEYRANLTDRYYLAGRAALFRYLNMDEAIASGIAAARQVIGAEGR